MEKLLQKFLSSDVIEGVKGKCQEFRNDSCSLYRFVTQPGPFNFVDTPRKPEAKSATPSSSLGKRKRGERKVSSDCELFANEYASTSFDEESLAASTGGEVSRSGGVQGGPGTEGKLRGLGVSEMELGSPVKQMRPEASAAVCVAGSRGKGGGGGGGASAVVGGVQSKESAALVARVSKEVTLNR